MLVTIPGKPISQARFRAVNRGRYAGVYDPTAREKARVKKIIASQISQNAIRSPVDVPLTLTVTFYFEVPKRLTLVKRKALATNPQHINKPDIDNLVKFYLDCATGLLYEDDRSISCLIATKCYAIIPYTTIEVEANPNTPTTKIPFPSFKDTLYAIDKV